MDTLLRGIDADGRRLVATRAIRSLGDGFASVALAAYLSERGFSAFEIGLLVTVALFGKSVATLIAGFVVDHFGRRRTLMAGSLMVMASSVAFALAEPYWLLLVVAFAGTLSPSAGDFSLFQPIEQAALATTTEPLRRTWLYARYTLFGSLAFALGSLASGAAGPFADATGVELATTLRWAFALYGLTGIAMLATYRPLTRAVELEKIEGAPARPAARVARHGVPALRPLRRRRLRRRAGRAGGDGDLAVRALRALDRGGGGDLLRRAAAEHLHAAAGTGDHRAHRHRRDDGLRTPAGEPGADGRAADANAAAGPRGAVRAAGALADRHRAAHHADRLGCDSRGARPRRERHQRGAHALRRREPGARRGAAFDRSVRAPAARGRRAQGRLRRRPARRLPPGSSCAGRGC